MAMALVKDLANLANQLLADERPKVCHRRVSAVFIQRVRLIAPLFEEIKDLCIALPPSALLAFREFKCLLQSLEALVEECRDGSRLWCLLQGESICQKFQEISLMTATTLRRIPLNMLDISLDMKEQIQLVRSHSEKAHKLSDPFEENMRQELMQLLEHSSQDFSEVSRIRELFESLHLRSHGDVEKEIDALRKKMHSLSVFEDKGARSMLQTLIRFACCCQRLLFGPSPDSQQPSRGADSLITLDPESKPKVWSNECVRTEVVEPPNEFICPISFELMKDPVTVATGQTYDRSSILKWLAAGNRTCPKSGLRLIHVGLIPNYALKSVLNQWCDEHNLFLDSTDREDNIFSPSKEYPCAEEYLHSTKLTAAFLVGKLATGSPDVQDQAVFELRLLAKTGMENRKHIAEAGAIPFLVPLLSSTDSSIQANAVTALLNLSIYDNNKTLIIAAGGLDPIIELVRVGKCMEARENAAATVFSLSVVDDYKGIIGNTPHAIPALLDLLLEGSIQGKKDAISTLLNLSLCDGNRDRLVTAGVVPALVDILKHEGVEIIDDALAILAVLAGSVEGLCAINSLSAIPEIGKFLNQGSSRTKENAVNAILSLCRLGGKDARSCVLKLPDVISSLQSLIVAGTPRARRKARSLLKLLLRCNTNIDVQNA